MTRKEYKKDLQNKIDQFFKETSFKSLSPSEWDNELQNFLDIERVKELSKNEST